MLRFELAGKMLRGRPNRRLMGLGKENVRVVGGIRNNTEDRVGGK